MGYLHPALAMATFCLALYVFYTGVQRFRAVHLLHKAPFPWKKHVTYGGLVLLLWLAVAAGGYVLTQIVFGGIDLPEHRFGALLMLPLILIGGITGRIMDAVKTKRQWLPMVHGINNLILMLLALWQGATGWHLLSLL